MSRQLCARCTAPPAPPALGPVPQELSKFSAFAPRLRHPCQAQQYAQLVGIRLGRLVLTLEDAGCRHAVTGIQQPLKLHVQRIATQMQIVLAFLTHRSVVIATTSRPACALCTTLTAQPALGRVLQEPSKCFALALPHVRHRWKFCQTSTTGMECKASPAGTSISTWLQQHNHWDGR